MADEEVTAELLMNIPLRDAKASSKIRRADTAVSIVRRHVSRHAKVPLEDVWIDPKINELIWGTGRKNIASKISVKVVKLQDGTAEVISP
ncbi:MAG: 50S ribosomal protein L31e [Thermoplasmataceae archaeon]|jgi:large subunit ribosomal protein L31e